MTDGIKRRRLLVHALALPVAWAGSATFTSADTAKRHDIDIADFVFDPAVLEVHPGDQIRWTNRDISPHTATADDGSWDTGELQKGQSAVVDVTENMSATYFCAFHPHMRAKLIVL